MTNLAESLKPLEKVYCLGHKGESPFCDIYAERSKAEAKLLSILNDKHWQSRVQKDRRSSFLTLLKHGTIQDALDFYNEHVDDDSRWCIVEQIVRY